MSEEWYFPGPSLIDFHRSSAQVRVLVGGRGSGKTTGVAVEAVLDHCLKFAGARVYVLRKTAQANADTTLETFEQVFGKSGTGYIDTGLSLFKRIEGGREFRVPSAYAVKLFNEWQQQHPRATRADTLRWLDSHGDRYCSRLLFSGVPTVSSRALRFRGFESSMIILVEADQFERVDADLALACLRWKGAVPAECDEKGFIPRQCLILDTNPPSPRHWIAKWEEESKSFVDTNAVRFWHIRTEENRRNLPLNYIENLFRQYAKKPEMVQRMLEGQYAEAFDGSPVFHEFSQAHVYKSLPFPERAYLICSWDFGASANCNVFSAYWEEDGDEYFWDLHEYYRESTDTDTQCVEVQKILDNVFPFYNDAMLCAGIIHYCDPAGAQQKDTGRSLTVLASHNFYPAYRRTGLQESIALYNRMLKARDKKGKLIYRIDSTHCPRLYAASVGGYRYPAVGEAGFGGDEPLKGPAGGNYDHIADASRYGKANAFRLGIVNVDGPPVTGKLAAKTTVNRPRRYR